MMAKVSCKLSAKQIQSLSVGLHSDGGNLYLRVRRGGSRQFVMLYKVKDGKQRELSLGGAHSAGLTLAEARSRAEKIRHDLRNGEDPLELRKVRQRELSVPTFGEFANQFISAREVSWKNDKHRAQWKMTMEIYAAPIRKLAVDQIRTDDVEKILAPIWLSKHETASRVRSRIEMILNAAQVKGHISKDAANPARWKGHLEILMPKRSSLLNGHHAAMHYDEVPLFIAKLRSRTAIAALALEFLILTGSRTSEVLNMPWSELNLQKNTWTVSVGRMKCGSEHEVPLSPRCMEILEFMLKLSGTEEFVFPGQRRNKPLSNMALEMVLRRMGIRNATVHGFRSSFRDWAGDETQHSEETAEASIAHQVGNGVRRAYRRKSAFQKRVDLMQQWGTFCTKETIISAPTAAISQSSVAGDGAVNEISTACNIGLPQI